MSTTRLDKVQAAVAAVKDLVKALKRVAQQSQKAYEVGKGDFSAARRGSTRMNLIEACETADEVEYHAHKAIVEAGLAMPFPPSRYGEKSINPTGWYEKKVVYHLPNNVHDLKTWPQYFEAVESGVKTFELRKDDRPFAEGDILLLREFDPEGEKYTGRYVYTLVTYLARGGAIPRGYCVMAIKLMTKEEANGHQ